MAGDVLLRPPAIVALMEPAERDAGVLQRPEPRQSLEFGEVPGAELDDIVKAALGDDQAAVHIDFTEA